MTKTTLTRKLPALLLAVLGGQVALASAAGAAPGLLGLLSPPPPPPPAAAPPAAAAPLTMVQIEQKLADLHYDVGPVDGTYDDQTRSAVMAFEKVNGLERTGNLTDPITAQLMATTASPPPLVPGDTSPNKVEVDLRRQVLFLYEGGSLSKILPVSSGTPKTPTPTGDYQIYRQDQGWETSPLGRLYNSQYFVGGYAIHGALSVPEQPASHGCIRIPMSAADWFPQHVAIGTPVHVLAG
ncbi:MAG TPA: L,D-transpeptidase family protein [Acidimicrobiales bacterium]|jgi:peptidoglycan hydrolase-like protein with peptidoglycan-binding domain|nr:L,D-transpeptidase family protein [Acidimicrobiales bacterium]